MELLVGGLGVIVGLFLWSNIFGSIFGTLHVEKQMVAAGIIPKVGWGKIVGAITFAVIVLGLTAIFAKTFFYGALVGGLLMIFNIGKLRAEALENFQEEHARKKHDG